MLVHYSICNESKLLFIVYLEIRENDGSVDLAD